MLKFYQKLDYYNISETKWKDGQKEFKLTVPIKGVPVCTKTDAIINMKLVANTSKKLIIEVDLQTIDAPYSETFSNKDTLIVLADGDEKCIFYHVAQVKFYKSTIFKGQIEEKALEGMNF